MLLSPKFGFLAFALVAFSVEHVVAREVILERDGNAVFLYPRRFGKENPAVIQKISSACPGQVCGVLAGQAITPLLAAQPECSQQDMADAIIDASKQFDAATAAVMVAAAIEYRQAEKNTPPDFTTNPPTARNSVFCQKAPKNPQLNGLVQAQDPANDPNVFFDPALKASVAKGSQANTSPFEGAVVAQPPTQGEISTTTKPVLAEVPSATVSACVTEITVTVTGTAVATGAAVTVTAGGASSAVGAPAATASPAPAGADFGSCTVPQIEFGAGFDNRRETSFQPTDKKSFNHGSAQNIAIITRFICDTLTNSCKANQAAKDICATASTAASNAAAKTGAQADAFNAAFGITTNFKAVASIDDQGNVVSAGTVSPGNASPAVSVPAQAPATTTPAGATSGGIGNFGKCTVPQIEFATGFDNRKETSFQPVDKVSYNHGSAQNIDIITQFICDTLTNSCGADATAKATCATARTAASNAAKGTGAQADAFNAAFGITTAFSQVQPISNQGLPVGAAAVVATTPAAVAATTTQAAITAATPATNNANTNISSAAGNLQKFNGALGGVTAPLVTSSGNGQFQVTGNSSFNNQKSAVVRSCDVQNNLCANAANASGNKNGFTVSACNAQQAQCIAAAN